MSKFNALAQQYFITMSTALILCLMTCSGLYAESRLPEKSTASAEEPKLKVAHKATFAGGCFWCMEKPFDILPGVISTVSGYSGGHVVEPSYKQVTRGTTGHYEVVQISYDPKRISYKQLLEVFWLNIDPLDAKGQFCDKGPQYLSAIFYHNDEQKKAAQESIKHIRKKLTDQGAIHTPLVAFKNFYDAELYHQDYYKKNPLRYRYYRSRCGRDNRLEQIWGKAAAH